MEKIKKYDFGSWEEWYWTCRLDRDDDWLPVLNEWQKEGVVIARIFFCGFNDGIDTQKLNAFGHFHLQHTQSRELLSGVVVHGIKGDNVRLLQDHDRCFGLLVEGDGCQCAFVSGEEGAFESGFEFLVSAGENVGMPPFDLVRGWNFMESIETQYKSFNRVRDKVFRRLNIKSFPAATGIEAGLGGRDFLCGGDFVGGKNVSVGDLKSDLQAEAFEYGPRFSRGKICEFFESRKKKIYVSGTSSVGKDGRSVYIDNPFQHVKYSMECVEHLLEKGGGRLDDLAYSIIYVRDKEYFDVFEQIYADKDWKFPYVPLFVPICRPDLGFEMEGLVVV